MLNALLGCEEGQKQTTDASVADASMQDAVADTTTQDAVADSTVQDADTSVEELSGRQLPGVYRYDVENVRRAISIHGPNAKLISIGEMVHRTQQLSEVRASIVEDLIENHHVRLFLIEDYWADVAQLNSTLTDCSDATVQRELFNNGFNFRREKDQLWVKQICEWNLSHPTDKVTISGVDPRTPYRDTHALNAYFASLEATRNQPWLEDFFSCASARTRTLTEFIAEYDSIRASRTMESHTTCLNAITAGRTAIENPAIPAGDKARITRHLIALKAAELEQSTGMRIIAENTFLTRAEGMSDLIVSFVNGLPDTQRAVYVAHNYHIVKDLESATLPDSPGNPSVGYDNVGARLKRALGDKYFAIATQANTWEFFRSGTMGMPGMAVSTPVITGSVGDVLANNPSVQLPVILLPNEATGILMPSTRYTTGVMNFVPADQADAFVFIPNSVFDPRVTAPM